MNAKAHQTEAGTGVERMQDHFAPVAGRFSCTPRLQPGTLKVEVRVVMRRNDSTETDVVRVHGVTYPVVGKRHIGKRPYVVLKQLGRGRTLAFDPNAGPEGDLRLLHDLPKSRATTQHVTVLSRLNRLHSTLPVLLEHQVERDRILLVTKWVRGFSLREYLAHCRDGKRPWPSPAVAISLFRKLAHGISQLHNRVNVVHGDIQPGNVILADAPRELVLIDFGSAWLEANAASREDGDGVQDFYAAPELRDRGATASERSDQFSLFVMLYEMLSGELPFEGLGGKAGGPDYRNQFPADIEVGEIICRDERELPARIKTLLADIFRRGLAFDPEMRFRSSREFRDAFDEIDREFRSGSSLHGINRMVADAISWITGRSRR
jgi:serine/threonine protein kinase